MAASPFAHALTCVTFPHLFPHTPAEALYDCPVASYQRLGAHVLPLYPESACGVHPICTDVNKLTAAR